MVPLPIMASTFIAAMSSFAASLIPSSVIPSFNLSINSFFDIYLWLQSVHLYFPDYRNTILFSNKKTKLNNFLFVHLTVYALETCMESESYAMLAGCGEVEIVETADILHVEEVENVVDANEKLSVWALGIHEIATLGECHQSVALPVLLKHRVVLVRQSAP